MAKSDTSAVVNETGESDSVLEGFGAMPTLKELVEVEKQ